VPLIDIPIFFNVKDYGAKGDGVTPDDDAIRQAVEACTSSKANGMYSGGVVYFPPGLYIINNPLVLTAAINVRLAGTERFASTIQAGPKFPKTLGAVGDTNFPVSNPVIKLVNCGYCGIENMAIFGNSNPDHRPSACIASFRDATVPQSVRGTHGNFFSNLVLGGIQSAMVYYGIAYDYSGLDANNDTGYHENIEIDNHTESGVYMRGTQCRPHMFINCVVQGGTHGYFDGENSIGAQFAWIGGTVVNTTVSAFELHGGTDGGIITILGVTAENNRRFLTQSGIGNAHAVTIRDCNMGNDLSVSLPDDGEWIKYFAAGPLIIDGCHIGYSQGIDGGR
jgi:hypothetical protein